MYAEPINSRCGFQETPFRVSQMYVFNIFSGILIQLVCRSLEHKKLNMEYEKIF